jgi:hypothetical protein
MRSALAALLLTLAPALAAAQATEPSPTLAAERTAPRTAQAHAEQTPSTDFPGAPVIAPDLAFADASDPNPGSGRRQILAGWISTGIGAAAIAQLPLCHRNDYDDARSERSCTRLSISAAILGLAAGIPWLVFGYQKRVAQRAWRARHGLAHWIAPLHLAAQRDGASLFYQGLRF